MSPRAILILNLGTPADPSPASVGKYLKEFLLDPEVIDIPWIIRQVLVRLIIVPFRKYRSAKLYQKIWTAAGSPLWVHLQNLQTQVQGHLPKGSVFVAFRYGEPSIDSVLKKIQSQGFSEVLVFPLYPQYATSTTRSTQTELDKWAHKIKIRMIQSFHQDSFYIESLSGSVHQNKETTGALKDSHFVFSFHGIPHRHLIKESSSCGPCLENPHCQSLGPQNCYKRQCTETARALAKRLGLAENRWILTFQSRLGKDPWLSPSTEATLRALPSQNKKSVVLMAPGFPADCLETLEELDHEIKSAFLESGGEFFLRLPCLNADPTWAKALAQFLSTEIKRLDKELPC